MIKAILLITNTRQSRKIQPFVLTEHLPQKIKICPTGNRFKGSYSPPALTHDALQINANHKRMVKSLKKFHETKKPEEQKLPHHKLILIRSDQIFLAFRELFQDFVNLNGKIAHNTGQALSQMQETLKCQEVLLEFLRRNSENDIYLTLPKVKKSYQVLNTFFKAEVDASDKANGPSPFPIIGQ